MRAKKNNACLKKALQFLTRRDYSCAELTLKLGARGFENECIQTAVRQCQHWGYLNDERFAHTYTQQLQRKGYGLNSIKHKLFAKHLSENIILTSVAPLCDDDDQRYDCRQVLAKKIRQLNVDRTQRDLRAKLHRFLLGRGFSPHIIRQVMEEDQR